MSYKTCFPDIRSRAAMCTIALVALSATGLKAGEFVVSATTDIWLAGQPNGSSVTGSFGTDTAPANSPVDVSGIGAGDVLNFSISAYTPVSVDGSCYDSHADGACYADEFGDSPGPVNGISLAHLPAGALVGVFVDANAPPGRTPSALDFTASGIGTDFLTLSPDLDQLFFIGDGLTGTGTGSEQDFVAPAGATDLYLAVADSVGASGNNSGSITVDASVVTPEPGSFGLLASTLGGGLIFMLRHRRN